MGQMGAFDAMLAAPENAHPIVSVPVKGMPVTVNWLTGLLLGLMVTLVAVMAKGVVAAHMGTEATRTSASPQNLIQPDLIVPLGKRGMACVPIRCL